MRLVERLADKGVLVDPKILSKLETLSDEESFNYFSRQDYVNEEVMERFKEFRAQAEILEKDSGLKAEDNGIRILEQYKEYEDTPRGEKVEEFRSYFEDRYKELETLLSKRRELDSLVSINKISRLEKNSKVSVIGMVSNKYITRNGHTMLNVEDETGEFKVLLSKNSSVSDFSDEIVEDEVIGIKGASATDIIFARDVVFPEIPLNHKFPKGSSDSIALFTSDLHIGSQEFMEEEFVRFIDFLKSGGEIAGRAKYLFICGDLVDGLGVYKNQVKDLIIKDAIEQYDYLYKLLKQIPKSIEIIACPGNHDVSRIAEPQPKIPEIFAEKLYKMKNFTMTSNPALVSVEGIKVLLYHGTSLLSIMDTIPSLRKIGHDQPHEVMKYQLKKRHLAPIYGGARMFPEEKDNLLIKEIPHIFHSGHVHSLGISSYRNIRIINSGCFQSITEFMAKIGNHPNPAKVPYVDFKTGGMGVLNFRGEGNAAV